MMWLGYQGLICMVRMIDDVAGIPGTDLHGADDR
jgi:hypothetical protein